MIAISTAAGLLLIGPAEAASSRRSLIVRPQSEIARPDSPLLLHVSIKKQRVRVFDANGEVTSSRISSGQPGFDTPTGVFSILEKNEVHESNIYEGAAMPHMQRLTWSGIALHAGNVPGYRASHGCIRLPASFAKSLFGLTKIGARVVVAPDEAEPVAFDHPKLYKPLPAETPRMASLSKLQDATQVATNDLAAGLDVSGLSELPRLIGISPALAEAAQDPDAFVEPDRPRSRAEIERIARTKATRLQEALKAAEDAKAAASEKAKQAVKDAEAFAPQLAASKQVLDPLRSAITAADDRLNRALADFAAFMNGDSKVDGAPKAGNKKSARRSAAMSELSAEDREADLEDAILDARIEADGARAELARREQEFATTQGAATAADAARTAALEDVRQAQAQLKSAQADLIEANKETVRSNKPIAVFISTKTERIYIRQGFEPLLEAPLTLSNSARRFGTHVFTAMGYDASNPDKFDWRLLSAQLPASTQIDDDAGSKKSRRREPGLSPTPDNSVRFARMALEAIDIPKDIQDTISKLARPGSSLIISDHELPANENGLGTEFVVLTR